MLSRYVVQCEMEVAGVLVLTMLLLVVLLPLVRVLLLLLLLVLMLLLLMPPLLLLLLPLQDVAPAGLNTVFERFRTILHEGEIDKRVQYMIENLFAVRKVSRLMHHVIS